MIHLPLSPTSQPGRCAGPCRPLPAFYMNDFSVMGLRVDDLDRAVAALERGAFEVIREGLMPELALDEASDVPEVLRFLSENGVRADMADVAGSLYQG